MNGYYLNLELGKWANRERACDATEVHWPQLLNLISMLLSSGWLLLMYGPIVESWTKVLLGNRKSWLAGLNYKMVIDGNSMRMGQTNW